MINDDAMNAVKTKVLCCWIAIITMAIFLSQNANAQEVCFNYKGAWSAWEAYPGRISKYTDDSGLILRSSGGIEFFKFQISNYRKPTKKEIKEHYKNKQPFTYYGTVDYYVSDRYPTAEDWSKASTFIIPNPRMDQTPTVLRHTVCEIRILPYKKHPEVYFVGFDNIAVEISVQGLKWD
jgi:hypothetical protein